MKVEDRSINTIVRELNEEYPGEEGCGGDTSEMDALYDLYLNDDGTEKDILSN